jgi:hypothetical protein
MAHLMTDHIPSFIMSFVMSMCCKVMPPAVLASPRTRWPAMGPVTPPQQRSSDAGIHQPLACHGPCALGIDVQRTRQSIACIGVEHLISACHALLKCHSALGIDVQRTRQSIACIGAEPSLRLSCIVSLNASVSMYSMHVLSACALCMCSLHVLSACTLFMCSMHVLSVCALRMCSIHAHRLIDVAP